jgi:hypothetical protein
MVYYVQQIVEFADGVLILSDIQLVAICFIICKAFHDSKVNCEFSFFNVLIQNFQRRTW